MLAFWCLFSHLTHIWLLKLFFKSTGYSYHSFDGLLPLCPHLLSLRAHIVLCIYLYKGTKNVFTTPIGVCGWRLLETLVVNNTCWCFYSLCIKSSTQPIILCPETQIHVLGSYHFQICLFDCTYISRDTYYDFCCLSFILFTISST